MGEARKVVLIKTDQVGVREGRNGREYYGRRVEWIIGDPRTTEMITSFPTRREAVAYAREKEWEIVPE